MRIAKLETMHADGGWRVFSYLKISTDEGLVGWAEYAEGFGAGGLSELIHKFAPIVAGMDPRIVGKISASLQATTRLAAGGLNSMRVSQACASCKTWLSPASTRNASSVTRSISAASKVARKSSALILGSPASGASPADSAGTSGEAPRRAAGPASRAVAGAAAAGGAPAAGSSGGGCSQVCAHFAHFTVRPRGPILVASTA